MGEVRIETLQGEALLPLLPTLAHLRIEVFRDFPYLYDGDDAAEVSYLRSYAASPNAAVILASVADTPIGAATCLPLRDADADIIAPFRARGWDPARFFYFGESVLLRPWRGRGIGVAFFDAREAHARRFPAIDFAAFCGIKRPDDHPARPADWVPLDDFWRRRRYSPYPDLTCIMSWRDIGHSAETPHTLTFWMKSLTGAALP
ncbi:MAG: GNAT family N-acetyltransferase [Gammaproteobacteria bacterium]